MKGATGGQTDHPLFSCNEKMKEYKRVDEQIKMESFRILEPLKNCYI
jgi:hypothetical protein